MIKTKIKNITYIFAGFISVIDIAFALGPIWNATTPNIAEKEAQSTVSSSEFNRVINTLQNISNDGSFIGINTNTPQSTLDINGGLTVRSILPANILDGVGDCSTIGTDSNGKFKCKPTYDWVYSGWDACTASCGGGTQKQTAICRRDDGMTFGTHIASNALGRVLCGTPSILQNCNTHSCCTASTGVDLAYGQTCKGYCEGLSPAQSCASADHDNDGEYSASWKSTSCTFVRRGWPNDCGKKNGYTASISCKYFGGGSASKTNRAKVTSSSGTCNCSCP